MLVTYVPRPVDLAPTPVCMYQISACMHACAHALPKTACIRLAIWQNVIAPSAIDAVHLIAFHKENACYSDYL